MTVKAGQHLAQEDVAFIDVGAQLQLEVVEVVPVARLHLPQLCRAPSGRLHLAPRHRQRSLRRLRPQRLRALTLLRSRHLYCKLLRACGWLVRDWVLQ